jgi:phosphoribulokinase
MGPSDVDHRITLSDASPLIGPVLVGVVGDSGAGRTTLIDAVRTMTGGDSVLHLRLDDYHKLARHERRAQGVTALSPSANDLTLAATHLAALHRGVAIRKPVYRHDTGTFGPPEALLPAPTVMVSGLLGYSTATLAALFDLRIFMDPDDQLWAQWKRRRDTSERGYDDDGVRKELEARWADRERFVAPQRDWAHLVVAVIPPPGYWSNRDDARLNVRLTAREASVAAILEQVAEAAPQGAGRPLVRLSDGEAAGDLLTLHVDGETPSETVGAIGAALGLSAVPSGAPALAVPAAITAGLVARRRPIAVVRPPATPARTQR